jgi:hypothetical protein
MLLLSRLSVHAQGRQSMALQPDFSVKRSFAQSVNKLLLMASILPLLRLPAV